MAFFRKGRNSIALCLFTFAVSALIWAVVAGQEQDQVFNQDYSLYVKASQLIAEEHFNQAEQPLKELLNTHSDSYVLMWKFANCLAGEDKLDQAKQFYDNARLRRPFVVNSPSYLVSFAQVLYRQGQYERATAYLERAQGLNSNPEMAKFITQMLEVISKTHSGSAG